MVHHFRPAFRRHHTFVVTRPIRLSSSTRLEPGHVIEPGTYRLFILKHWYNRRRIAQAGSLWAEEQVKSWYERRAPRRLPTPTVPSEEDSQTTEGGTDPTEENTDPVAVEDLEFVISGSWVHVRQGEETVAKLNGRAAVKKWCDKSALLFEEVMERIDAES